MSINPRITQPSLLKKHKSLMRQVDLQQFSTNASNKLGIKVVIYIYH